MSVPQQNPFGPYQRFGIMGGSFDPVHVGHLSIAQQVLNKLKLDQVVLLPAAAPPHKQDGREQAPALERMEMCRLAVQNMHGLSVSDYEIRRGGISYTVETARFARQSYGPDAQIYFLIGSDSLADLPLWREAHELVTLIDFAIAERREVPIQASLWERIGEAFGDKALKRLQAGVVEVQRVDVSSTEIRRLLHKGERCNGLLRRDVEDYIRQRSLYGAAKLS